MLTRLIFCLAFASSVSSAFAHEFWISPESYVVQNGEELQARLRVGQEFSGPSYPFRSTQFENFELALGDATNPVEGRVGDDPALQTASLGEGLHIIIHQTTDSRLTYSEFEKFAKFARSKNFEDALDEHTERGISKDRFVETYQRFAKSLIAVGNGEGEDRNFGMRTEIVLLENPYTDFDGTVEAQVFLEGSPRPNTQVEVFERAPDQSVTITKIKTDASGIASVAVKKGHEYLLDSVSLVALENDDAQAGPVWKSLWAASTFFVPE